MAYMIGEFLGVLAITAFIFIIIERILNRFKIMTKNINIMLSGVLTFLIFLLRIKVGSIEPILSVRYVWLYVLPVIVMIVTRIWMVNREPNPNKDKELIYRSTLSELKDSDFQLDRIYKDEDKFVAVAFDFGKREIAIVYDECYERHKDSDIQVCQVFKRGSGKGESFVVSIDIERTSTSPIEINLSDDKERADQLLDLLNRLKTNDILKKK